MLAVPTPGNEFTNYVVDSNATGGVFSMGMTTALNTSVPFSRSASNRADNIFTSAISFNALAGDDLVFGTTQAQQLLGGDGNDVINGGGGADVINGGAGVNQIAFGIIGTGIKGGTINPYGVGVTVNLLAGTYSYKTTYDARGMCVFAAASGKVLNVTQVWGSTGSDMITGENSGDVLWGNESSDVIVGGSGGDVIFGDGNYAASTDGNDTIRAGVGRDFIYGGLGADTIDGSAGNNFIHGDYHAVPPGTLVDGRDLITAANGDNTVYGGGAADRITLGHGRNLVYGDYYGLNLGDAADVIVAGNGGNTVFGGGGADTVTTGSGVDLIYADNLYMLDSAGNPYRNTSPDTANPTLAGNDTVWSGGGNDTVFGGAGNDVISGGAGNDLLVGNEGDDAIYSGSSGAYSLVSPYSVGDRIYLSGGAPGFPASTGFSGSPGYTPSARYSIANPDPLSGTNVAWVGYDFDQASSTATKSSGSLGAVVLADFHQASDTLHVAAGAAAIVGGVSSVMDWTGDDTLDLRTAAADNLGLIVVSTGNGNDTIKTGSGDYRVYGNDGLNRVELQADTRADIYIDTFASRALVTGFGANDRIFVNKALVDAFGPYRQGPLSATTTDATTATVTDGQALNAGIVGALTFSATYNNYLGRASTLPVSGSQVPYMPTLPVHGYDPQPYPSVSPPGVNSGVTTPTPAAYSTWASNGAYPNEVYRYAAGFGEVSDYIAGSALLFVGYYVLAPIPFVGPIISIASIVLGALHINDAVNEVRPHLNATYSTSASLTLSYASVWKADGDVSYGNNSVWDNAPFLGLYQPTYDGAMPALEVTAADLTSNVANTYGIHSIVAVNTKASNGSDKTYIYLVNSPDNLVQNSEAKLLAQVDYKLTASQVVVYDGATDPYNQPGAVTPVLPAAVASVTLDGGAAAGNAIAGGYVTTSATPAIDVSFGGSLSSTDTIQLYNGDMLIQTLVRGSGASGTFDPSGSTARFASIPGFVSATNSSYAVVATSVQGFTSEWSGRFIYDANSPTLAPSLGYLHSTNALDSGGNPVSYSAGLRPTGSFLKVTSNKEGSAGLSVDPLRVNTGLTGSASTFEGYLKDLAEYALPSTAVSTRVFATDALGLRREIDSLGSVSAPTVAIGPSGGGVIMGGTTDVATYATGLYNTVYGGPSAGFVLVDDARSATAMVNIGVGLTLSSIDSVKINSVRHTIESYDAATGLAAVTSTAPGALGNASLVGAAIILTQVNLSTQAETNTSVGTQNVTFTGGVTGASTVYGEAAGQIIYGGGGADVLYASQNSSAAGISLVAGGPGQVLRSYGNADYLFDSEYGSTTLIGGGGADTIDVTHGNNTVRFLDVADATPSAHPLVSGFSAGSGTVFDLVPALTKALDNPATLVDEYAQTPLAPAAVMLLDLSGSGASLAAGEFGYAKVDEGAAGKNTYVLINAQGSTITGLTSTTNSGLEMVIKLAGWHTLSASDFIYKASIASASYETTTKTLVLTGTGFNTAASVDVTMLTWDVDGDGSATPGLTLSAADVISARVDSSTRITVTLTSAAGSTLEGLTGFAGATADNLDVAAGFLGGATGSFDSVATSITATVSAGSGILYGDSLNDTLVGTSEADVLVGGGGADSLTGGPGADVITLGDGSDTLIFDSLTGSDTVMDYSVADDSVQLSKATFAALGAVGALLNAEFYSAVGAAAGADATDRIVYDSASGRLYYDADGSGAIGAVLIGTFIGSPTLTHSEFAII